MGNIILEGALLGLTLTTFFGFGPAFFSLVQTSIHRGFGPAALLASGIFLSDLLIVVLCLMGAVQIITEPSNYFWFGLASGLILIVFGTVTFYRKVVVDLPSTNELPIEVKGPPWLIYIAKGFLLNIVNPFVWIFWIGVVVAISARYGGNQLYLSYFFGSTLLVVLSGDIIKSYGAFSIKRFMTVKTIEYFNKVAGILLIGFGVFLIGKVIFDSLL